MAIHIRRGDVHEGASRYTADENYILLLSAFAVHRPHARIVIFSTGSPDQFARIVRNRPNVHLNLIPDLDIAFHGLVTVS